MDKLNKTNLENFFGSAGISLEDLNSSISLLKQISKLVPKDDPSFLGPKDKSLQEEGLAGIDFSVKNMFKNSEIKHFDFGTSEDELKMLTAVEFLISENKILEAIKLIKWRKKK